jgi:hypothetical protein
LRLQYELWSDRNPFARFVERAADQVRAHRKAAPPDNPFLIWQSQLSDQIVATLDAYRDMRDRMTEAVFLNIYGSPLLQALAGIAGTDGTARQRPGKDVFNIAFVKQQIEALKSRMAEGGLRAALIRAMIYIGLADGSADERGFAVLKQIRAEHGDKMPLEQFKAMLREQCFMLLIDEERALAVMPEMVRREAARIDECIAMLRRVVMARGPLDGERAERLARVEAILKRAGTETLPRPEAARTAGPTPSQKRTPSTGRSKRGNGRTAASTA